MKGVRPYVLLVEDSHPASVAATAILKELGCLVDLAEGSVKALGLVQQKHYDMIFMDLELADINGVQLTEQIKAIVGAEQIPVVALTAYDDENLKEQCFKVGMVGFIKKPLGPEKAGYFLQHYMRPAKT